MRKPENVKSQPLELKILNKDAISHSVPQNACADFWSNKFGVSTTFYLNLKQSFLQILFENYFILFQQRNLLKIIKLRRMFHKIMKESLQFKCVLQNL